MNIKGKYFILLFMAIVGLNVLMSAQTSLDDPAAHLYYKEKYPNKYVGLGSAYQEEDGDQAKEKAKNEAFVSIAQQILTNVSYNSLLKEESKRLENIIGDRKNITDSFFRNMDSEIKVVSGASFSIEHEEYSLIDGVYYALIWVDKEDAKNKIASQITTAYEKAAIFYNIAMKNIEMDDISNAVIEFDKTLDELEKLFMFIKIYQINGWDKEKDSLQVSQYYDSYELYADVTRQKASVAEMKDLDMVNEQLWEKFRGELTTLAGGYYTAIPIFFPDGRSSRLGESIVNFISRQLDSMQVWKKINYFGSNDLGKLDYILWGRFINEANDRITLELYLEELRTGKKTSVYYTIPSTAIHYKIGDNYCFRRTTESEKVYAKILSDLKESYVVKPLKNTYSIYCAYGREYSINDSEIDIEEDVENKLMLQYGFIFEYRLNRFFSLETDLYYLSRHFIYQSFYPQTLGNGLMDSTEITLSQFGLSLGLSMDFIFHTEISGGGFGRFGTSATAKTKRYATDGTLISNISEGDYLDQLNDLEYGYYAGFDIPLANRLKLMGRYLRSLTTVVNEPYCGEILSQGTAGIAIEF